MKIRDYARHQHITATDKPNPGAFEFKRPNMKIELAIGKAKKKHKKELVEKPGRLLAHVLALALESIHGEPLAEMEDHQARVNSIMRLAYTDVMAMHALWNVLKARSSMVVKNARCPHCGHNHKELKVDLGEINISEVKTKSVTVPIVEPVQLGNENLSELTIHVPTFGESFASFDADDADDETAISMGLMAAAIAPTPRNVLFQLHPDDFLKLEKALDDLGGGPEQSAPFVCDRCEETAYVPYNWQADFS